MHAAPSSGTPGSGAGAGGFGRLLDARLPDRTRARTAVLHQLLLAAVVLAVTLVVLVWEFPGNTTLFFLASVVTLAATGVTLLIPWDRIPAPWLIIVPVVDILAIGVMRAAGPTAGLGLLWIFPVLWLASGFAAIGLVIGLVASLAALFATATIAQAPSYSLFLLPIVLLAVGVTSFLTARRAAAQRLLLDKQARLLVSALERTRQQEQEVTQVLDAVDFGVIRFAPDGSAAVVNEAHARLQRAVGAGGGSAELPVFREDGVTPLPAAERPLARAARGESFDDQLVWFGEPGQSRRALSVATRRATAADGSDQGAIVVSRDVTAEVKALQARDDLVASVSHELRTPLTAILGYLDLAVDDERVPAAVREKLEIAERNAERLLGIVADILTASSSSREGAELPVRPEEVDVSEIVRSAAESLIPCAEERTITIDSTDVEPALAHVDPLRLRQVVDNLIANAITYNRVGGDVSLGTTSDGRSTWILVRDTGPGLDERDRAGLFQRYFRGTAQFGRAGGTGLGLAISRDIARAHGGDITVRSAPGEGSTFIIRLPTRPPQRGAET